MTVDEFAIDEYLGKIIHGAEVQEDLFTFPTRRDGKVALIPHLIDEVGMSYTGQFTFRAKGNGNILVELFGTLESAVFA